MGGTAAGGAIESPLPLALPAKKTGLLQVLGVGVVLITLVFLYILFFLLLLNIVSMPEMGS